MRKINLKSIICLLAILFGYNVSQAQSSSVSVSGASSVCKPSTVTLNATFGFTTPSSGTYRVITEFWRYDVVGPGFCYTMGNDQLVATATSPSASVGATTVSQTTFYGAGNMVVQTVNVSGYYRAKSILQKQNGSDWDDISSAWSPWIVSLPTPDLCSLVAPKVEVIEPNHTANKFSINGVYVFAPSLPNPEVINIGGCHDIMMTDIGGNGDNAMIIIQKGTWGPDPLNPLLYKINSAVVETVYVSKDINTGFLDQNLSSLFPTGFFEDNKDYNIILKMDRNTCDVSGGQVSFNRVYHINRPTTPTISNTKINNVAVNTTCSTTPAQQYYACNSAVTTFDLGTFDYFTIEYKTYSTCGSISGYDGITTFYSYPSGGIDLRSVLPRTDNNDLTTAIDGLYMVTIRAYLCGNQVNVSIPVKMSEPLNPVTISMNFCGEDPDFIGDEICSTTTSQGSPLVLCFEQNSYYIRHKPITQSNIKTYSRALDMWDGSDWQNIWTQPTPTNVTTSLSALSPATVDVMGDLMDNVIYRTTIYLSNPCTITPVEVTQYFLVNHSCKTDGRDEVSGIDETDANAIKVYPNPTSGKLYVSLPTNNQYQFSLFTIDGKQVSLTQKNNGTTTLELDALSKGIYFLKIQSNTETETRKVIIE